MKFILATGGSGGHVIPAIMVARELKNDGHEVVLSGCMGRYKEDIEKEGFFVKDIPAKGSGFNKLSSLFECLWTNCKGLSASIAFLKEAGPSPVVGFGGYGSFSMVLGGILLRYPTAIHEQNVIPGKANKLLSKWVTRVMVGFPQAKESFDCSKTVVTGCPCQTVNPAYSRDEMLAEFMLDKDKKTILIFGGSQGSRRLNEIFLQAADEIRGNNCQILLIAGTADYNDVKQRFADSGIRCAVLPFLNDMGKAYCVADAVVARAGALTVSEIAQARIPAVLVPYPYAKGHQSANAVVLSESGLAIIIQEDSLNIELLKEAVFDRMDMGLLGAGSKESLERMFLKDASSRIKQEIYKLI